MNTGIPIQYFLILATIMFFAGIYGFLTRRNLITILMSSELILNSVNINFMAFNRYLFPHKLKPKLSGLLGTTGLGIITVLSYITAYKYFFTDGKTGEAFQKLLAFNTT